MASGAVTELYHCSVNADIDSVHINGRGCVLIGLCFQNQTVGWITPCAKPWNRGKNAGLD